MLKKKYENYDDAIIAEGFAWEDEACDAFGLVEKTAAGYRLCMEVPSLLFRFIIGKKGDTKRKIEKETGTQIMIPRQGKEGDIGECCTLLYRASVSIFISLGTYLRCTVTYCIVF